VNAELKGASQAKSEFLSRMSHELRTPLNAVLGFAQLLEMDSLSPQQGESVGHILKAGRHLLELINEVLDMARIEAGRLTISPEPVPLRRAVQEVLDLVAPLAQEANVRLLGEIGEAGETHVMADHQRLRQVLLNLLGNAIKFNRKGGMVLLSCETRPPDQIRIKVSDTGPGIPPDQIARIFAPFERLGAEQSGIEGTGLGLALAKRLVEAMAGTMGLESKVGVGSTFWIDLTRTPGPVERFTAEAAGVPAAPEPQAPPPQRTVLYVENNLSNLDLIQLVLAQRPAVTLVPAIQGRLGIDLARQQRPDLILLDLHLSDIPGEEVLRQLRTAPETRDIPVVVISADATRGQLRRLLAAGAYAYLTKPLDVKKFLDVLDEALSAAERPRPRAAASTTERSS
jgi:CheY-like chemotaxis protein/anti-sigma regulatory factor (Ser/Thr protein kinase)